MGEHKPTYSIEYAKSGRATCKETKEKIAKDELRIAKITTVMRGEDEIIMCNWHKVVPFFQMMSRMRKKEYQLQSVDDLVGFEDIKEEDQALVRKYVAEFHDPENVDFPPKKKRKAPEEEEHAEGGDDTAERKAPASKKKKPLPEIEPETKDVPNAELKAFALELVARCRDRGLNVPDDENAAKSKISGLIMSNRSGTVVDVAAVLKACDTTFGQKTSVECACEANVGLASAFAELASFEFKNSDTMRGSAYKKASNTIAEQTDPITSGKEAMKLPGIGKSSAGKIDEFLTTGAITQLTTYKNAI